MLVDEYQDTNRLQAAILRALKPDGRGLTVVGDDAQAIYSFRAATVRNILDFPAASRRRQRRHARAQLPLDAGDPRRRQRASSREAARAISRRNCGPTARGERPRWSPSRRADQARYVPSACSDTARRDRAERQAVLFRTSHTSDALELELTRRNIPFVKYDRRFAAALFEGMRGMGRLCRPPGP